jgi:hypothetical protein
MTSDQLDFDGHATPFPLPPARRLTERQRDMLRWMRAWDDSPITTREARRFFADPTGALKRLEKMGLIYCSARGFWKPVR